MECLITSNVGNASKLLAAIGYSTDPTKDPNIFHFLIESIEELVHLVSKLGINMIVSNYGGVPIFIINN